MTKIHSELSKHDVSAWIGLFTTTTAGAEKFFWVDNSPYDFTNWEEDEPNSPGVELCVQVYGHNGKWNDFDCNPYYVKNLGYVCKADKVVLPTSTLSPSKSTSQSGGSTTSAKTTSAGETTTHGSTTQRSSTSTSYFVTPPQKGGK